MRDKERERKRQGEKQFMLYQISRRWGKKYIRGNPGDISKVIFSRPRNKLAAIREGATNFALARIYLLG